MSEVDRDHPIDARTGDEMITPMTRRRRWAQQAAVLVAMGLALGGCWLQPGFGPHRSGHNDSESGLTSANVATLHQAWSVDLGDDPVLAPAVSTNGLHAVAGNRLFTRRLVDGADRWSVAVLPPQAPGGRNRVGAPSVRGDQVLVPAYVPTFDPSPGRGIHSYDTATGSGGTPVVGEAALGSVTVSGSTLVGTIRETIDDADFDWFSKMTVTDLADPSKGWYTITGFGGFDIPPLTTASIGADQVLFAAGNFLQDFTRKRPADCQEPQPGAIFCRPTWSRTLDGAATVPVLSDDERTVYVGDAAGTVWSLNALDGSVRWSAHIGGGGIAATPTVGEGSLFVTTSDGRVWAFDAAGCGAASCAATWIGATGSAITEQPALAGGVLYVGSDGGTVNAYRAAGCGGGLCAPVWTTSTGSRISGAPIVANGNLVVGTADGRLITYRPS
jgi:hypothetical protein